MSASSSIEWTDATWNPTRGCTRVSEGCRNCLAPTTDVLTADFKHRAIGDLVVGDRLLAFDEFRRPDSQHRKLREAVVEAAWQSKKPLLRIITARAEVVATAEHRWLRHDGRKGWQTTAALRVGTHLRNIEAPSSPPITDEYRLGYLAGMTLGDGTFRYIPGQRSDKLGWPQAYWRVALADDEPLGRLVAYLSAFGVPAQTRPFADGAGSASAHQPMRKVEVRALARLEVIHGLLEQKLHSADHYRGFLAGFFDAEGSHGRVGIRMAQMDVEVLRRVQRYGAALGFNFTVETSDKTCPTVRLAGTLRERIRFFATVQPSITRKLKGLVGREADAAPDKILAIEPAGFADVVDIQTSTGTFFANSLATHNCYAEVMAARFSDPGMWGHGFAEIKGGDHRWTGKVALIEDQLTLPLRWKKPRRIFVNSTSDLFHEALPFEVIDRIFAVMARCPQHTFQVLTKRPERMRKFLEHCSAIVGHSMPLPNVWLGTSIEDQATADERIPHLLATPAAVRFVSYEPALGPVDFRRIVSPQHQIDALRGWVKWDRPSPNDFPFLDWVICGGESGRNARPMHPDWARSVRDQCSAADTKFFFKQWGAWGPSGELARDSLLVSNGYIGEISCPKGVRLAGHGLHQCEILRHVGKVRAGRLLDGVEHNGFPDTNPQRVAA